MKVPITLLVLLAILVLSSIESVVSFSLGPSYSPRNEIGAPTQQRQQRKRTDKTIWRNLPKTHHALKMGMGTDDGYDGLGEYDPSENLPQTRDAPNVGDPQIRVKVKDPSVTDILKELAAIQQQGPQKYCILGTRHCSYLHQQIIELLYVPKIMV